MGNKGVMTKILAIIGTVLIWVPLLMMLVIAGLGYLQSGQFTLDYFLPEQILPLSLAALLVGGIFLLWAAIRARSRRAVIGIGLLIALILIISSNVVAITSGLAAGQSSTASPAYYTAVGGIIGFDILLIVIGNAGIGLIRDLFKKIRVSAPPEMAHAIPEDTSKASGEVATAEQPQGEQAAPMEEPAPATTASNPPQPPPSE